MTGGRVYVRVLGIEASLDLEAVLAGTVMALRAPLGAVALWRELAVRRENQRRLEASAAPRWPALRDLGEPAAPACPRPGRQLRRPRRAVRTTGGRWRPVSC